MKYDFINNWYDRIKTIYFLHRQFINYIVVISLAAVVTNNVTGRHFGNIELPIIIIVVVSIIVRVKYDFIKLCYYNFNLWYHRIKILIPLHRDFINFFVLLIAISLGASITNKIMGRNFWDIKLPITIAVIVSIIVRKYMMLHYKSTLTHDHNDFFLDIREKHPVTQKFASSLIGYFLSSHEFPYIYQGLFFYPNQDGLPDNSLPNNLKSLVRRLEDEGLILTPKIHALLLKDACDFFPTNHIATWDTEAIPLEIDPYIGYFNRLKILYDNMRDIDKERIFIFNDKVDYDKKTAMPIWRDIMCLHLRDFKFEKIYYAFREQFVNIRESFPHTFNRVDDFALFSSNCHFIEEEWIIAKEPSEKGSSYLISDKLVLKSTRQFFSQLISELNRRNQVIILGEEVCNGTILLTN